MKSKIADPIPTPPGNITLEKRLLTTTILAAATLLATTPALAHVGDGTIHHHGSGFMSGLLHPIFGLDHLIAMVAVGLWAAQMGGRMIWALPVAFAATMIIGGILALGGVPFPFVEPGIAASMMVVGLLIAFAVRLPLMAGCVVTGLFAFFHGHAHGAEMAAGSGALLYFTGFALTTLFLHAAGIGMGMFLRNLPGLATPRRSLVYRTSGALVTVAGVVTLVALL
ncbi:MAG: HupE/UreJ family protein [Candidatus Sumerlaeia bacterium]|nr:HupE/UreJ family protein [Candidatus Sumerlaeia bacterium]